MADEAGSIDLSLVPGAPDLSERFERMLKSPNAINGSGGGVGHRRCREPGQYTVTGVPMAATPLDHSMSMAELVTRAQPCDAGWAGMLPEPWMAMPPLKYLGR